MLQVSQKAQEVLRRGGEAAKQGRSVELEITCAVSDVTTIDGRVGTDDQAFAVLSEIVEAYIKAQQEELGNHKGDK